MGEAKAKRLRDVAQQSKRAALWLALKRFPIGLVLGITSVIWIPIALCVAYMGEGKFPWE